MKYVAAVNREPHEWLGNGDTSQLEIMDQGSIRRCSGVNPENQSLTGLNMGYIAQSTPTQGSINASSPMGLSTPVSTNRSLIGQDTSQKVSAAQDSSNLQQKQSSVDPSIISRRKKTTSGNSVQKVYKCNVIGCARTFLTAGHLGRHIKSHSGERPFCCPIGFCTSRFSRKDNMVHHYRVHLRRLQNFNIRSNTSVKSIKNIQPPYAITPVNFTQQDINNQQNDMFNKYLQQLPPLPNGQETPCSMRSIPQYYRNWDNPVMQKYEGAKIPVNPYFSSIPLACQHSSSSLNSTLKTSLSDPSLTRNFLQIPQVNLYSPKTAGEREPYQQQNTYYANVKMDQMVPVQYRAQTPIYMSQISPEKRRSSSNSLPNRRVHSISFLAPDPLLSQREVVNAKRKASDASINGFQMTNDGQKGFQENEERQFLGEGLQNVGSAVPSYKNEYNENVFMFPHQKDAQSSVSSQQIYDFKTQSHSIQTPNQEHQFSPESLNTLNTVKVCSQEDVMQHNNTFMGSVPASSALDMTQAPLCSESDPVISRLFSCCPSNFYSQQLPSDLNNYPTQQESEGENNTMYVLNGDASQNRKLMFGTGQNAPNSDVELDPATGCYIQKYKQCVHQNSFSVRRDSEVAQTEIMSGNTAYINDQNISQTVLNTPSSSSSCKALKNTHNSICKDTVIHKLAGMQNKEDRDIQNKEEQVQQVLQNNGNQMKILQGDSMQKLQEDPMQSFDNNEDPLQLSVSPDKTTYSQRNAPLLNCMSLLNKCIIPQM